MIDKLLESSSVSEANSLLSQGWVLIKSAELQRVDNTGHQITTITYILGHVKEKGRRPTAVKRIDAASSTTPQQTVEDPKVPRFDQGSTESTTSSSHAPSPPNILSLPIQWRQKRDLNPNFYYSFVFGLDGELDPVVSSVVYAIKLSNSETIEQDGWRFTVSKDGKFLQRSRPPRAKVVNT
jgi:hypothetical protein